MFYVELFGCVVDGAVLVVVVADSAVEQVVLQDAVEGFALGDVDGFASGFDVHACGDLVAQARTSSPLTLTMQVSQLWIGPICGT